MNDTTIDNIDNPPASAALRKRVGLVIGAGGLECAASIGLWRVLQCEGLPVDVVTGVPSNSIMKATLGFNNLVHYSEIVTLFPDFDRPVDLGDTHLIPYLAEQGERAAEEQLPYIKELLER